MRSSFYAVLLISLVAGFSLGGECVASNVEARGANGDWTTQLGRTLSNTRILRVALAKMKKQVAGGLPSSMIEDRELEALVDFTRDMRRLRPSPLPSLFDKEAMAKIALEGEAGRTITGSQVERRRLRKARDDRKAQIDALKKKREELARVKNELAEDANHAERLQKEVGDKLLVAEVEIVALMSGRSVVATFSDLVIVVVPALHEGVNAAEGGLKQLDAVITQAEADLGKFSDAIPLVEWLFSAEDFGGPGSDGSTHPAGVDGVSAGKIRELERDIRENVRSAEEMAKKLQRQAEQIAKFNQTIDQLASLLAIGSAAADLAQAGAAAPAQANTAAPSQEKNVTASKRVNVRRSAGKWEKVPPATTSGPQIGPMH